MRTRPGLILFTTVLIGCSSQSASTPSDGSAASPTTAAGDAMSDPALVGEWHAAYDCETISDLFGRAGLDDAIADTVVANGLIPDVSSVSDLADPANLCEKAVPRDHALFFTADGNYGSLDSNGEQEDGGLYQVIDADTIKINDFEFTYRVDGDTLMLDTPIPDCATAACDFNDQWRLLVAMPGTAWVREP